MQEAARIVLRPIAFLPFGIGSGLQLGVVPRAEMPNVALPFGRVVFPAMLVAGILAFLSRETLGTTLLGLISFSWLGTYTSFPDNTSAALGLLDLVLAAVLLLMGTVGLLGKPLLSVVIVLASVR